ncbi:hypothetical protein [Micromonospora citrea]|uniref:hypothetical protein n=1 Tax=Micromonospora citrea TaxID=47855 RepID=UPI00159F275B|nr:hypothetical protein [Micromonospora citrea]
MRLLAALLGAILILVTASPADAAPSHRTLRPAPTEGLAGAGAGLTGGTRTG